MEILYRGMRVDAKEFVYGFIFITTKNPLNKKTYWIFNDSVKRKVIPESVGQFTGETYKNNKKIFVGDILYFTIFDCFDNDTQYTGVVVFLDGSFRIEVADEYYDLNWVLSQDCEAKVIGTIHDNPELMEESEIKWIPVSEKLPSHYLPVLVKDQYTPVNANYAVAYHNGFEWLPDIEAINIIGDAYTVLCSQPTHWCEIKGKGEIS